MHCQSNVTRLSGKCNPNFTEMQKKTNNQLIFLNKKLSKIAVNVTSEDRKKATSQLDLTRQTISNYLNGKGESIDTGVKVLQFFSNRINKRAQALAE